MKFPRVGDFYQVIKCIEHILINFLKPSIK